MDIDATGMMHGEQPDPITIDKSRKKSKDGRRPRSNSGKRSTSAKKN